MLGCDCGRGLAEGSAAADGCCRLGRAMCMAQTPATCMTTALLVSGYCQAVGKVMWASQLLRLRMAVLMFAVTSVNIPVQTWTC